MKIEILCRLCNCCKYPSYKRRTEAFRQIQFAGLGGTGQEVEWRKCTRWASADSRELFILIYSKHPLLNYAFIHNHNNKDIRYFLLDYFIFRESFRSAICIVLVVWSGADVS